MLYIPIDLEMQIKLCEPKLKLKISFKKNS